MAPRLPRDEGRNVYDFQAGDTLYSLARWARTSLPALRAANPDLDPRGIDAGMAILLPPGAARPEALRARERGAPAMIRVSAPRVADLLQGPPPPQAAPSRPPRPPLARPAPQRDDEDADKPKPDDDADEEDGPTPGGMDDGGPEPDGM
jgi:hypothetical protein